MPTSTVKMQDGSVACETPDGTVINIHITQRSALDCLLDGVRSLRKRDTAKQPIREAPRGAQSALGASQISLGCISVMIAVVLCFGPSMYIFWNGTLFWVGFPFIVSGALSVVAEKRPTGCLIIISALSHMVSLGVSIAGLVMISHDLSSWQWSRSLQMYCDTRSQDYGWPPVTTLSYNNDYRLQKCKRIFNEFQNLNDGLQIMILLLMVWGLCISLFSLGFRLKHLCCGFFVDEEKEKDPPLLDSSSYKNIEGV